MNEVCQSSTSVSLVGRMNEIRQSSTSVSRVWVLRGSSGDGMAVGEQSRAITRWRAFVYLCHNFPRNTNCNTARQQESTRVNKSKSTMSFYLKQSSNGAAIGAAEEQRSSRGAAGSSGAASSSVAAIAAIRLDLSSSNTFDCSTDCELFDQGIVGQLPCDVLGITEL